MPRIQLKHVVSFTSEDPKNPADNLLKPEDYYKWKCATPGENRCVVELQFDKATKIHSVDIGNNGAAFVEILVGRSSWDSSQDYKVLLAASSFMSPSESKLGTATFRVRMFGPDKLNKSVAAEKWDRVKIACTQPYNKTECYGLSFVTFHSPPEEEAEIEKDKDAKALNFKKKIGKFTLKDESEDDELQIGSYFAKKMQHGTMLTSPSSAAAARDASASIRLNAMTSKPSASTGSISTSVKKADQTASSEPKERQNSISKREPVKSATSNNKGHDSALPPSSNMGQLNEVKNNKKEEPQMGSSRQEGSKRKFQGTKASSDVIEQKGEELAPPSKKVKRRTKNRKLPFHRIMRNVVFVLSGYKNPQRSDLRQQAISMGAQYRPDWESGCTHLICAFKNTPKYNQVLGQGKIVTHKWITDCAKKRERISIKNYRIDGGASSSDSDSDSDSNSSHSTDTKNSSIVPAATDTIRDNSPQIAMEEPMPGPSRATDEVEEDECDTEDELRKARDDISFLYKDKKRHSDDAEDDDDEYGGSTEDESDNDRKDDHAASEPSKDQNKCEAVLSNLPPLPNYFNRESFLIYGDFEPTERRRLVRYITAYNGVVCDYMNDNIKYVISDKEWDGTFDETAASNSSLEFIRPSWIIKCHEEGQRVPPKDFQIDRP